MNVVSDFHLVDCLPIHAKFKLSNSPREMVGSIDIPFCKIANSEASLLMISVQFLALT
jgi:hypothetical protein